MSKPISIAFCLVACLFMVGITIAEEHTNNFEFSIAGSAQAFVYKDETVHLLNMPIRFGCFATPNLLIEAEGIVTVWDEELSWEDETTVRYILSMNGSYNIQATDQLMPFFLLGFGFTNDEPMANIMVTDTYEDMTIYVLNAGTGMKVFFSPKAALRVEYRLQKFNGEKEMFGHVVEKVDYTMHSTFFGVSLFF